VMHWHGGALATPTHVQIAAARCGAFISRADGGLPKKWAGGVKSFKANPAKTDRSRTRKIFPLFNRNSNGARAGNGSIPELAGV
jgi:hypothetical protein